MKIKQLIKNKCEIDDCNVTEECALHYHHIIDRVKVTSTNSPMNIAVLCSVHHNLVHDGKLKIISVYPSTKLPNRRTLVYELNGIKNIEGLDEPYITILPKSYKL